MNHHVGWIDALCKAYRDIPSRVVNVLNGSHPMHAMVLRCREPDRPVTDLHAASDRIDTDHSQCIKWCSCVLGYKLLLWVLGPRLSNMVRVWCPDKML